MVPLFLQYSTQWDSFAHAGAEFDADGDGVEEAVYYNGYRAGVDLVGPKPEGAGGGGGRARCRAARGWVAPSTTGGPARGPPPPPQSRTQRATAASTAASPTVWAWS